MYTAMDSCTLQPKFKAPPPLRHCPCTSCSFSLFASFASSVHLALIMIVCKSNFHSEFSSLYLQVLTGIGIGSFATDGDLDKHEDDAALEQVILVPETVSSN
jgi:hypothetical protein